MVFLIVRTAGVEVLKLIPEPCSAPFLVMVTLSSVKYPLPMRTPPPSESASLPEIVLFLNRNGCYVALYIHAAALDHQAYPASRVIDGCRAGHQVDVGIQQDRVDAESRRPRVEGGNGKC